MKNIKKLALPLLLAIFSTTALVSCERTVEVPVQQKDNDTYSAVYELRNVSFVKNPNTGIYIAVAGMIIGLAGIFITIFKN